MAKPSRSPSRRTKPCSRCCGRAGGSRGRKTAASWASAAPVPCCSTPRRSSPVWCSASPAPGAGSRRSRGWRRAARSIRSRRPSPSSAPRSAAIAHRRSSSPPRHSSRRARVRRPTRSSRRSRATSAAAPVTSRSTKPSSWRRLACAERTRSRRRRPCMASGKKPSGLRVVGKAHRKVDATAKVTGVTRFADDLFLPRMLFAKLLRSPHPHARILSIDTSRAASAPGVKAVLTGKDLPIPFGILPVSQDEHALALDKVRFVGDPVAAVAATTEEAATQALDLITVEYYVHRALAKVLELPAARIRVIACPNGGGFGGKSDPFSHEIVAAKLATVTGRPVKITLTREEVFYCHRGRHPTLMWVKTGLKKDGAITGMHFKSLLDGGGYGSYGVASTYYTGALQTVTYHVPRYRFQGARAFTNKPPCGPKRGHGTPQPRFALEVHLDKIAEQLGMDPAELRLKHLVPPNSLTANWLRIGTMGLGPCIEKVIRGSGWKQRFKQLPYGKGIGLACSSYITGAGLPIYWNAMPHSGVQLKCDRGGGVTVFCGSTEIGQGSDSILATIVAEVLGLDPFDIAVVTGDTDLTPVDLGSYSSRVTLMTGNAAIQAAERARDVIALHAGKKLEAPLERVTFAEGRVFDVQDPERGLTFAEAVQLAEAAEGTIGTVGSCTPAPSAGKYRGAGVGPSPAYSYSACVAEVDVDPATGIVRVPKIWIAHDVGRAINAATVMGQIEGSVYMGLGEALMEEMAYRGNRNVVHKIPSLLEYKSPTTLEMCDVVTYVVEDPDPNGPFGAKECGQGPLLPVPPAVANAVYDAIGVRIDEVPITPERVFKALKAKGKGEEGRVGPKTFPEIPWPEPTRVPPPWEGGDGKPVEGGKGRQRAAKAKAAKG